MAQSGKILGVDYGTRRIGLAVSDQNGRLAFPKEVVKNNGELMGKIGALLKAEQIIEAVVGESLNNDSMPNTLMKEVDFFISNLERKFKIPIHREREFFTSFEAHVRMGKEVKNSRSKTPTKTPELDARAAALILQRYLDRKNNSDKKINIV